MKTDFAILWVDDNKDFVESLKPQLESWMNQHGFSLVVHWHKSESGVASDLKTKDIELIVLDYKLPKKNGDEIIKDIRSKNCFQDIIFYSQGGDPHSAFTVPPDGIFFVDRNDAKDRIKQLIELKIRRLSDLATVRGWIVADAIELESVLGRLLGKCFKSMETLFIDRVLSEEGVFDCGKKHKILNGILKDQISALAKGEPKSAQLVQLQACKKILDVFPKEIIEIRNALAHQIAEISETGHKKIRTRTKDAKEILITHEECVKMRQNVRKHQANLSELGKLI